ncbi:uncharacterized protein LOC143429675 [Xylocopa sonorina]|uniref:uncharacterized protein LOC143429675 n=1 Tax=Xylocopa sonorina TaxID=1818115 RepID=UPI00403B17F5
MHVMDEDEDVVIKGSSLYEHLQKLGYTDFESVTVENFTPKVERRTSKISDFICNVKNIFRKLRAICLGILQDDNVSKKQVETILNAKILLNDHGCTINSFLDKYDYKPWRTVILKFMLFGTILSSSMYISYKTKYRNSANLFALTVLWWGISTEYLRVNAHVNLKSVVSLQNDVFDLSKKGMKILKYGYKIKLSKGKSSQQFFDLTAGRLKYLQPLMEDLVKCLESISFAYYHVSLILLRLLPIDNCKEDLLTRLEDSSFRIYGEVNYQKLKTLYYTYILTQSEMLHLLAIAYDNHIWHESCKKIPEFKLAYIIRFLIKLLTICKKELSEDIDAYYSFKLEPMLCKFKNSDSSQWQDLYMHLHLASNKLQLAYSHILSVIRDIDNDVLENLMNEDSLENTVQKLSVAKQNIENAKDFVEFSSLFLVKTHINGSVDNRLEINIPTSNANSNHHVITDSEPEIMDEVYEEYIKEEYLKPLSEETDEISLYNYKRDKILFENFMTELKDALIDTKKSMSERESKALQRMYKNAMNDGALSDQSRIPTPPPMPSFNSFSIVQSNNKVCNDTTKTKLHELSGKSNITEPTKKDEDNLINQNIGDIFGEDKSPIIGIPLPRTVELSPFLASSFLKAEEETFIGSGENSEDDETTEVKTE